MFTFKGLTALGNIYPACFLHVSNYLMSGRVNSLKSCERAPGFYGRLSTQPAVFPCKRFHAMSRKEQEPRLNLPLRLHFGRLRTSVSSKFPTRGRSNVWEPTQGCGAKPRGPSRQRVTSRYHGYASPRRSLRTRSIQPCLNRALMSDVPKTNL